MIAISPQTPDEKAKGTWTISSRIYDALARAESRFGSRDASYQFSGFDFRAEAEPRLESNPSNKSLILWLGNSCQNDMSQAIYQSAHEVIHILAPAGAIRPTNFEEGLATMFSEQYLYTTTGLSPMPGSTLQPYAAARDAVVKYLVDDAVIQNLRSEEPTFAKFTAALLVKHNSACDAALADFLCASFAR